MNHAKEKEDAVNVYPITGQAENFRLVSSQLDMKKPMTGRWIICFWLTVIKNLKGILKNSKFKKEVNI